MKLSQELIAILAVGVTLIGMMSAVFVSMGRMENRLRGEMSILRDDVRHDIDALRIDIRDIREDVRQLRDKLLVPAASASATG